MNEKNHSDEYTLIELIKGGDQEAFNTIMSRYKRPIIDFAYRMLGDAFLANDMAQDVFFRAWRNIGRFEHRANGSFSTWLFQIARNACLDHRRKNRRDPLRDSTDDAAVLENAEGIDSVSREVKNQETAERIAAAVARLPEDQRAAVVLSEYEGQSYKQIAEIMQCSVKSVETRLYRARKKLRDELSDLL